MHPRATPLGEDWVELDGWAGTHTHDPWPMPCSCPQPMSREYQNGDGFGYLLSFRRQGSSGWQTARVPGADAQYFVYSNDSVHPYTPFEVKIRSYNRRGDGPESLTALVYSAEEGGLWGMAHLDSLAQGRRGDLWVRCKPGAHLESPWASSWALGCPQILNRYSPGQGHSVEHRGGSGMYAHSLLVPRAQSGPCQGLGQGVLILRDERELGACATGHEWHSPGV